MSEDLISPASIKIEPGTVIVTNSESSKYISPVKSKDQYDGKHVITLSNFEKDGEIHQVIPEVISDLDKCSDVFSQQEQQTIKSRVLALGKTLENDASYREKFKHYVLSHESAHEIQEKRFGSDREYFQTLDGMTYRGQLSVEEFNSMWNAKKDCGVYEELSAVVVGIRNLKGEDPEKNLEFFSLWGILNLSEVDENYDSFSQSMKRAFESIRVSDSYLDAYSHHISYIIAAANRVSLLDDVRTGVMNQEEFVALAVKAFHTVATNPQQIFDRIQTDTDFSLKVDQKLMSAIADLKEKTGIMQKINSEAKAAS